jgi:hypothetical protein
MPSVEPKRIEVFGFDLAEAAQIRRIRALVALGHQVHSFTMRRANMNADFRADWPNTHLFVTRNENLLRRAFVVLAAILRMNGHKDRLRAADVILARNLDMLALAWAGRALAGASQVPLIYECLDIHAALTDPGVKGRVLRRAERFLLRRCQMLVVSSPGFIRQYFAPVQGFRGQWALWENKLAGTVLPERPRTRPAAGAPLRIGWMGSLRCAPSLALLAAVADRMGAAVEIHLHGAVHHHALPGFAATLAARKNLVFHGPYAYPVDLPRIYGSCDLVWAQDLWQQDGNSDWLLPNRIYEASWAGCPSLALKDTETGRRVAADGLGWVIETPDAAALVALLERLTPAEIAARGQALRDRPAADFVQAPEEIQAVIHRVTAVPPPVHADPATVLVAIPTLNEAAHIGSTLTALLDGNPQMAAVKIVVADGGSSDDTCRIVEDMARRHPNLHLIHNPARRQAAAVNLVVATAAEPQHEILVRVDAHAHYPPGYVLAVADSLLRRQAAALATVLDSAGSSCFQRGAAWAVTTILGSGGSGHRSGRRSGPVDHGHHAGFRLDLWRQLGGYDEGFAANEDAELDHRIGLAGGRIWLDAGIRLGYVMRPGPAALARQYWHYGQGRAQTVLKHRMRPRLRQMLPPLVVLVSLLALLMAPLTPWVLLLPVAYLALLSGTALLLALRHRSPCALWAAPALLVMHLAWGSGFLIRLIR